MFRLFYFADGETFEYAGEELASLCFLEYLELPPREVANTSEQGATAIGLQNI